MGWIASSRTDGTWRNEIGGWFYKWFQWGWFTDVNYYGDEGWTDAGRTDGTWTEVSR